MDLTDDESEDLAPLPELILAGAVLADAGGELPTGRRIIDISDSIDNGGFGERSESFELPRPTRDLLAGLERPLPVAAEEPSRTDEDADEAERTPWPEIRFYLGSAALFFISFILATAFWVFLPTVVLGWDPTAITSGSMEPAIRAGDVVVGNPEVPTDLGLGSVVTFESNTGRLITHRVVAIDADGRYVTRGDANFDPDRPPIDREDIQSVGRILVPFAGYPSLWAQSGAWWAVASLALAAAGLVTASRWALLERFNPWNEADPAGEPDLQS